MIKKYILIIVLCFTAGWLSASGFGAFYPESLGVFSSEVFQNSQMVAVNEPDGKADGVLSEFNRIEKLFSQDSSAREKDSPYDFISTGDILVYSDRVVIKVSNPEWAVFTDTNSMDPVIDSGSNAIEVVPETESDIHVGDIVAYRSVYKSGVIVHRVVEIGSDSDGWYALLKGDNNPGVDPGKIRFSQVERIVVGIIY